MTALDDNFGHLDELCCPARRNFAILSAILTLELAFAN
jgi:hypothetical protein